MSNYLIRTRAMRNHLIEDATAKDMASRMTDEQIHRAAILDDGSTRFTIEDLRKASAALRSLEPTPEQMEEARQHDEGIQPTAQDRLADLRNGLLALVLPPSDWTPSCQKTRRMTGGWDVKVLNTKGTIVFSTPYNGGNFTVWYWTPSPELLKQVVADYLAAIEQHK